MYRYLSRRESIRIFYEHFNTVLPQNKLHISFRFELNKISSSQHSSVLEEAEIKKVKAARRHTPAHNAADQGNVPLLQEIGENSGRSGSTRWTRAAWMRSMARMVRASSPSSARMWLMFWTKLVVPSASDLSKIS